MLLPILLAAQLSGCEFENINRNVLGFFLQAIVVFTAFSSPPPTLPSDSILMPTLTSGVETEVTTVTFPDQQCLNADSRIQLSGKITQTNPGPTELLVKLRQVDSSDNLVDEESFTVKAKATKKGSTISNQKFSYSARCFNAGEQLQVLVTSNADIEDGAEVSLKIKVKGQ
jgi:hypothetical protein